MNLPAILALSNPGLVGTGITPHKVKRVFGRIQRGIRRYFEVPPSTTWPAFPLHKSGENSGQDDGGRFGNISSDPGVNAAFQAEVLQ